MRLHKSSGAGEAASGQDVGAAWGHAVSVASVWSDRATVAFEPAQGFADDICPECVLGNGAHRDPVEDKDHLRLEDTGLLD